MEDWISEGATVHGTVTGYESAAWGAGKDYWLGSLFPVWTALCAASASRPQQRWEGNWLASGATCRADDGLADLAGWQTSEVCQLRG